MKKYFLTFIALTVIWSCQTDEQYQNLNVDPKNPTEVSAEFLFTSGVVALSDQLQTPSVNANIFRFITQYLTMTTYTDETNYDLRRRSIAEFHWSEIYRDVLLDLNDAKQKTLADERLTDEANRKARIAQIEVMIVYAWQTMVDVYGNIPYTEALQPKEFPLPAYDDAATIYEDLITRLLAARTDLTAGQGFTSADVIYGGDMAKWNKFANSLLLRLGMRITDVNPALSKSTVDAAIAGGLISTNSENAVLNYEDAAPNTNPMWEDFVQSGRSDYVVAETIVDMMNNLDDPRRATYFDDNKMPYIGGDYGDQNTFKNYTHIGELFRTKTIPGIFLDLAEVEFFLSEAAASTTVNYNTTIGAKAHYENAVTASILYWNGTQAEATTYLTGPAAYDGTETQLATQFWIAMYNNPLQSWCTWRKYDAPALLLPVATGNPVPLRYTYPVREQNLNHDSWSAAAAAIGGDEQQTPIFWDVK